MANLPGVSLDRLHEHFVYQTARFEAVIRSSVIRPAGGDASDTYRYVHRCYRAVLQELIADASVFSKAQWLWYLRRLPDEAFAVGSRPAPGSTYERNIAETISGIGGTSASPFKVTPDYQLSDSVADVVIRFVAGANYLSNVLEQIQTASRGIPLRFTSHGELPVMPPNRDYVEASELYFKRRRREGSRFLSRIGTDLDGLSPDERLPTSLFVIARAKPEIKLFEEVHVSGATRSRPLLHCYVPMAIDISQIQAFIKSVSSQKPDWPSREFCDLALTLRLCSRLTDLSSVWASVLHLGYLSIDNDHLIELFEEHWDLAVTEVRDMIPTATLSDNARSLCIRLQDSSPTVLPLRPGPLLRIDRNLALFDFSSSTFLIESTAEFSDAQGAVANLRARHFEEAVQSAIDSSAWRPPEHLRQLRGRTLRRHGAAVTDVDSIAANRGRLLLISAKSVLYTSEHAALTHRATRNAAHAVVIACNEASRICADLMEHRHGDNYEFAEFSSIHVVVCLPYVIYVPIGPATREVFTGLRAAASIRELKRFLGSGSGP